MNDQLVPLIPITIMCLIGHAFCKTCYHTKSEIVFFFALGICSAVWCGILLSLFSKV